jgi:hypothetical protein
LGEQAELGVGKNECRQEDILESSILQHINTLNNNNLTVPRRMSDMNLLLQSVSKVKLKLVATME